MSQQKTTVGAKVTRDRKDRLTEIAERLSSDEETVTVSDLIREKVDEIIEEGPESEISECVLDSRKSPPSGDFDDETNGRKSEESAGVYNDEPEVNPRNRNVTDGEGSNRLETDGGGEA